MKYLRSTTLLGYKDIGTRKSEFWERLDSFEYRQISLFLQGMTVNCNAWEYRRGMLKNHRSAEGGDH